MEHGGGEGAVLTRIVTLTETGSTNADLLDLARSGAAEEGMWLRAERQTGGRGRQGRPWVSPAGNLYASTLVRVRDGDPAAPTLALVAGVAVWEAVVEFATLSSPFRRFAPPSLSHWEREGARRLSGGKDEDSLRIKWPNDILLDGAKLAGILLERAGDAVVIGCGVNVASHPTLLDRPATSLAAHGVGIDAAALTERLADRFAHWLAIWRDALVPVVARWRDLAHPPGTPLSVHLPDGTTVGGSFAGVDPGGALLLDVDGVWRTIHAGDVFLL